MTTLFRREPGSRMARFYRAAVAADLFGGVQVVREWGRIGSPGRVRADLHPDPEAALAAVRRLLKAKGRKGYHSAVSGSRMGELRAEPEP